MLSERASRVEAYSDHITNGAFIIGQARKDWRDLDFAVMRMRMSADDKTIVETEGGHVQRRELHHQIPLPGGERVG